MNIDTINEMIAELIQQDANYVNCRNLASLYTLKQYLQTDNVEKEYKDILPEYHNYCEIKKKYQMHELTEDAVVESIKGVCYEIYEFILLLYRNTDMNKERKEIRQMLEQIEIAIK